MKAYLVDLRSKIVAAHIEQKLSIRKTAELFASLRKQPGCIPSDLLLAQLRGCISGPMAYFASRKRLQEVKGEANQF